MAFSNNTGSDTIVNSMNLRLAKKGKVKDCARLKKMKTHQS
jgi:hypothetical protein